MMLFEPEAEFAARTPNLSPAWMEKISATYGGPTAPEAVFHYVYAVLYAEDYRTRYAEFLRGGFPRIPFSKDRRIFDEMAALGERLAALHLLRSKEIDPPVARCQGPEGAIDRISYSEDEHRVYLHPKRYFEGVRPEVWRYRIGGYAVCEKWLKDRKGRTLSLAEIRHYCRFVTALEKTLAAQEEIDKLFAGIERNALVRS